MAAHDNHGAQALGLAASSRARFPAAGLAPLGASGASAAWLMEGQKDEAPGWQAEGDEGYTKPNSQDCAHHALQVQVTSAAGPTMNSREIAELTSKEHKNVMADIRSMLDQLGMRSAEFSASLPDSYGRPQPAFRLPKDLTITLVSGYSATVRHRIVTRWQQLERAASPALPDFTDPAAAARAWADQHEQRQRLEVVNRQQAEALAIAAPKAAGLDRIATATEGAICLRQAAKLAQVHERQFFEFLRQERWIFKHRSGGSWMGYSDKETDGLLELKRRMFTRRNGTEGTELQVLLTPLGQAKVAELIERKAPHMRKAKTATASQQTRLLLPVTPPEGAA